VIDRTRIAGEHTRELQALGLERRVKHPRDLLEDYVAQKYGGEQEPEADASAAPEPEPTPRPRRESVP
jgi:hypothetical protein